MTVRCKFKVQSILMHEGSRRKRKEDGSWLKHDHGGYMQEPCMAGTVKMSPVYANDDALHENSKFWDASPSGEFTMQVNNLDALAALKVGEEYLIDIRPAK